MLLRPVYATVRDLHNAGHVRGVGRLLVENRLVV